MGHPLCGKLGEISPFPTAGTIAKEASGYAPVPRVARGIFMCSISLDPEHDTPRVLTRYARQFGAKPGWLFL